MYITLGDLMNAGVSGFGELKVGDTARGAFTAALPKPPIRHMWEMVPGTGETPPGGGLITYLYKLVRYEPDPEPIDFTKLNQEREAELIAQLNAKDTALQKMVEENEKAEAALAVQREAAATAKAQQELAKAEAALAAQKAATQRAAADLAARKALLPWYRKPVVIVSVATGTVVLSLVAILLMARK